VCSFRTSKPVRLKDHIKLHTGDRPFACNNCGYQMRNKSVLEIQQRTHTGEKLFACERCKSNIFSGRKIKSLFDNNKSEGKKLKKIITDIKQEPADDTIKLGACDETSYEDTKQDLKFEHLVDQKPIFIKQEEITIKNELVSSATITNNNTLQLDPIETVYVPECKPEISKNNEHKTQSTSISKPKSKKMKYECQVCLFSTSNLNRHMELHTYILKLLEHHDTENKLLNCKHCSFTTFNRMSMKKHKKRHANKKCSLCNFVTTSKLTLEKHMKSRNKENSFACDKCNFKTNTHCSLRMHKQDKKHKVFKCNLCNFKSLSVNVFRAHKRKHKQYNEKKLFYCDQCLYFAPRKSLLDEHKKTHSAEKLPMRQMRFQQQRY